MNKRWYEAVGPDGDIVISTRVRLARNLAEHPFPGRMSPETEEKLLSEVSEALVSSAGGAEFSLTDLRSISHTEAQALVERHLISPELAKGSGARGVVFSRDESISVMINEEDHIRIQVLGAGLCLEDCLKRAWQVDDLLEGRARYAFDERLGYLTHCPTNLGTGLRASVMLHLPALTESGEMRKIINACSKLGFAVRGLYGEGSSATGSIYQLSNQLTLGLSEEESIKKLSDAVRNIINSEKTMRDTRFSRDPDLFEDRIWRAAGTLTTARIIDSAEAAALLSELRCGLSMGLMRGADIAVLNRLSWETQPACLSLATGAQDPRERDKKRAELIRRSLEGCLQPKE